MTATGAVEGFWDFSVRTYRTNGVPDACLSLQNEHGADVNMLLYCCWVGAYLGKFETEHFDEAIGFAGRWADKVVIPLRSARTWMKLAGCTEDGVPTDDCMRLRDKIKSVEFASEKLQQQVLESLVSVDKPRGDAPGQVVDDVVANLLKYAGHTGIDISGDVRQKLIIIVTAAFPNRAARTIETALSDNPSR